MNRKTRLINGESAVNLKVFLEDLGYTPDEYENKPVLIFQKYTKDEEEKIALVQKGTLADVFKRTKQELLENLFIQINSGKKYWKARKRKYIAKDGNATWNEKVEGRKKTDIIRYNAFMLDFDLKNENKKHYKGGELIAEKKKLLDRIRLKLPLKPDYVIESRNGFHVYYLIQVEERKMSSDKWHWVEIGIFNYVKENITDNVDYAVKKSNQIMRLPYSFHKKDDDSDEGYQVRVIYERKSEEKEECFKSDCYEAAMFAYPTTELIKKFKIAEEEVTGTEKKEVADETTPKKDIIKENNKSSIENHLLCKKYEVTKAISEGNIRYFSYLQKKAQENNMTREEATQYIRKIDLREILGFEKQGLRAAFSSLFYEDKKPSDAFVSDNTGNTVYYCRRENKFYYDIFDIVYRLLKVEGTDQEKWKRVFDFVYEMFGIKITGNKEENKKTFDRVRANNIEILKRISKHSKKTKYMSGFITKLYEKIMELWKAHSDKNNLPWKKVHMTLSVDFLAQRLGKKKRDSTISKGLLILEFTGLIKRVEGHYKKNKNLAIANEYEFPILKESDIEEIIEKIERIRDMYKKPINEVTRKIFLKK